MPRIHQPLASDDIKSPSCFQVDYAREELFVIQNQKEDVTSGKDVCGFFRCGRIRRCPPSTSH